ncbi:RagB/SusD family nutrient uptake outer membrane protein [Rapidithrix thailandica]|uniref:RagB/SusD family nutrient uptake outer membrane protein n=1 Tax=Rapidithrix thailandica TaxID=413964 RepID=A0AAW9S2X8_9BACT
MKKILLYISIFFGLTACSDDFLDRDPLDKLSNGSFWTNENDALVAVNACYAKLDDDAYHSLYMDCASDNAYNQFTWDGYTAIGNGSFSPTDNVDRFDFTIIRRCNSILENIEKISMDETLKKRLKGETRFMRAYSYFWMTQLYGDVPLVTTVLDLKDSDVERAPRATVVEFLLKELGEIAADLPLDYSGDNVGRATRGAALSLKARIELYEGKFSEAANTAKQVMDLGVYDLFPDYVGLFTEENENNQEVIFDVQYIQDDYASWIQGSFAPNGDGGWSSVTPIQSLVDAYECLDGKTIEESALYDVDQPYKNRDPRLDATVLYPGAEWEKRFFNPLDPSSPDHYLGNNTSKTGYNSKKYIYPLSSFANIWNNGMNVILMRYAEVLLIYAEAKVEAGQIDQSVYDALNAIRTRAGMPDVDQATYSGQASLRQLIRRERRVELAMEGFRWFDIVRWKTAETVMNKPVMGVRNGTVNPTTGEVTFTSDDHIKVEDRKFDPTKNYLWPVPQADIDATKNPKLKQNPNY